MRVHRNFVNFLFSFIKFSDPIRLSLSSSFGSLMFQLVNQTMEEKATGVFGALPKVCLVVSQSHQISELDFESAQRILLGSMKQFPDLYFVFLSNDVSTFKEMVGDDRERTASEKIVSFRLVSAFLYIFYISIFPPGDGNTRTLPLRNGNFNSTLNIQAITRLDPPLHPEKNFISVLQGVGSEALVGRCNEAGRLRRVFVAQRGHAVQSQLVLLVGLGRSENQVPGSRLRRLHRLHVERPPHAVKGM